MSSSALIDAAEAPVHVGLHWGHSGVCRWGHRMLLEQLAIGEGNSAVNTHSSTRTTDLTLHPLSSATALGSGTSHIEKHAAAPLCSCVFSLWSGHMEYCVQQHTSCRSWYTSGSVAPLRHASDSVNRYDSQARLKLAWGRSSSKRQNALTL